MSRGEVEDLDPTLEQLLGRKPKDVADVVEQLFKAESNKLDTKDFV